MIKNWNEFIREFVNNPDSVIDAKMQEIKDLVDGISDGQNMIYEWENNDDHQLTVSFSTDELSIKYEFDIDDFHVTKIAGDVIDFQCDVESIDEGLDIIEKDIQSILGISEKYQGEWSSSISWEDASDVIEKVVKVSKLSEAHGLYESDDLISEIENSIRNWDKEVIEFVVDSLLFCDYSNNYEIEEKIEDIIRLGDKIMNKYGTEPRQVINAYDISLRIISRYYDIDEEDEEITEARKGRPKAQRYKGRKIPGKYLTKNPSKMKKEIDTFRGKKEYKKDWDADYSSGKGGVGKRVKTKKSAATKAYQRMFGDK